MTETPKARIVTPDRRATQAAQAVLDAGGSAVDAMITASAVLCVVYPQNVTLGGDTWTLVAPPAGEPIAINGTGRAPAGLSAQLLIDQGHHSVPGSGPHSISVPGLVAAWGELHQTWGRTPFAELIIPARDLAAAGSPVAPALARDLRNLADVLIKDPGCAGVFFRDGSVLAEGDLMIQPALAGTLDQLAADGPGALYGGAVGRRYADGLQRAGSTITIDDLAGHRTDRVSPLSVPYAGLQVLTTPPSSQGFTLLKILRLLTELELDDPAAKDQAAMIMNAVALAGQERDAISGDPDFVRVDVDAVLADDRVRAQAAAIRGRQVPDLRGGLWPPLGGDTIGMVAVDADGLWVSSVQSVAGTFGSRVLEPSTGILAHNRGSGFSLDPRRPGHLVGGRRPPHTLMPSLIRRRGRTIGAIATMGGHNQPFVVTQVLCRILAGDDPQQAVAAPRWVVQRERQVLADERLDEAVRSELAGSADLESVAVNDNRLGHAQAIWTSEVPGELRWGTDPRADGGA
ncbi:MAG: gamma-glutamyltransferase [Microlunatus sp.]|nr:gamma-glutamyltransferase [Microlunatus sp.]